MGSSESRSARPVASPPGRHPTTGEGGHFACSGKIARARRRDSTARPFGTRQHGHSRRAAMADEYVAARSARLTRRRD